MKMNIDPRVSIKHHIEKALVHLTVSQDLDMLTEHLEMALSQTLSLQGTEEPETWEKNHKAALKLSAIYD